MKTSKLRLVKAVAAMMALVIYPLVAQTKKTVAVATFSGYSN